MSYIINNTRGQIVAVVGDGTVNTAATDLALVGRAVTNYGDYQNENYVYLLENFANGTAPTQPILGQLWYDSSNDLISAYNTANVWVALASQDYVQLQKVSPAFSGTPTAPTAAAGTGTTQIATTAFVQGEKISPAFTGTPTAPTATAGTNTVQIATTAFVSNSPAFNGVPTAPTAAYGTNTTQLATTAFVQNEKVSTSFSGIPTVPTAANGTSTTQIASTEFVINNINTLGTMAFQDSTVVNISGGSIVGITDLLVADGGTGASTPSQARINLGLGTMSTQDRDAVSILGGSISGITDLSVADGGTGASNAADARTNLGLATGATTTVGTLSVQNANSVAITGGAISGITPLAVADGGTGGATAAVARTNLGVPPNTRTITGTGGLTGGGDLSSDRTITIATTSNGYGTRYIGATGPNIAGVTGDIWYQIVA